MVNTYTAEECAKHNTESDCWIIFKGKVYDVSEYLDDHPGGLEIVIDCANGIDCQDEFEDVGHSEEAYEMLDKYYIGDVGSETSVVKKEETSTATTSSSSSSSSSSVSKVETSKPVASVQPPKSTSYGMNNMNKKKKSENNNNEENNTILLIVGAVAVAGIAFMLWRRKK